MQFKNRLFKVEPEQVPLSAVVSLAEIVLEKSFTPANLVKLTGNPATAALCGWVRAVFKANLGRYNAAVADHSSREGGGGGGGDSATSSAAAAAAGATAASSFSPAGAASLSPSRSSSKLGVGSPSRSSRKGGSGLASLEALEGADGSNPAAVAEEEKSPLRWPAAMPSACTHVILRHLGFRDIASLAQTSSRLFLACRDPIFWELRCISLQSALAYANAPLNSARAQGALRVAEITIKSLPRADLAILESLRAVPDPPPVIVLALLGLEAVTDRSSTTSSLGTGGGVGGNASLVNTSASGAMGGAQSASGAGGGGGGSGFSTNTNLGGEWLRPGSARSAPRALDLVNAIKSVDPLRLTKGQQRALRRIVRDILSTCCTDSVEAATGLSEPLVPAALLDGVAMRPNFPGSCRAASALANWLVAVDAVSRVSACPSDSASKALAAELGAARRALVRSPGRAISVISSMSKGRSSGIFPAGLRESAGGAPSSPQSPGRERSPSVDSRKRQPTVDGPASPRSQASGLPPRGSDQDLSIFSQGSSHNLHDHQGHTHHHHHHQDTSRNQGSEQQQQQQQQQRSRPSLLQHHQQHPHHHLGLSVSGSGSSEPVSAAGGWEQQQRSQSLASWSLQQSLDSAQSLSRYLGSMRDGKDSSDESEGAQPPRPQYPATLPASALLSSVNAALRNRLDQIFSSMDTEGRGFVSIDEVQKNLHVSESMVRTIKYEVMDCVENEINSHIFAYLAYFVTPALLTDMLSQSTNT